MRVTASTFGQLVRAVPRVASLRPQLLAAALTATWVVSLSGNGAETRLRFGMAAVAATGCFVFDDEAAHTLAGVPVTRAVRRLARLVVAAAIVVTWVAVTALAADARFGTGIPSTAALVEVAAVAAIAAAVALVVMKRSDDERGGLAGTGVALLCVATIYLPPHWWWPLTAQPETTRLLLISAAALGVALLASADPARRRRWFG